MEDIVFSLFLLHSAGKYLYITHIRHLSLASYRSSVGGWMKGYIYDEDTLVTYSKSFREHDVYASFFQWPLLNYRYCRKNSNPAFSDVAKSGVTHTISECRKRLTKNSSPTCLPKYTYCARTGTLQP